MKNGGQWRDPIRFLFNAMCAAAVLFPAVHFGSSRPAPCETNSNEKEKQASQQYEAATPASTPCPLWQTSLIQIGGNYTWVSIHPQGADKFTGNTGGAQAMYEYRPLNNFYAGVKSMWREGKTTAPGATRTLCDIDVHERLGYTFSNQSQRYRLTLFTGLGYRYLGEKLTQLGSTLKTNYNEFYVPVGILTDIKWSSFFSIGVNGIWMPQVDSTVTLIPVGNIQWDIKRRLKNCLVEVPLNFYFGPMKQYLVILKPFFEYWQDGPSTGETSGGIPLGLPGNTYHFWGAECNFGYQF